MSSQPNSPVPVDDLMKAFLMEIFPTFSDHDIENLAIKLQELGCSEVNDVQLATEADLSFLKPIQRRKLLRGATERFLRSRPADNHLNTDLDTSSLASTFVLGSSVDCVPETDEEDSASSRMTSPSATCSKTQVETSSVNFAVPWHKFPSDVIKKCKKGSRIDPGEKRRVVSIVGDEMVAKGPECTKRAVIKRVARQLVDKYPNSFQDRKMDGGKLGDGFQGIFTKLENYIYNDGQKKRRQSKRSNEEIGDDATVATTSTSKDKYGCIKGQWKPACPDGETMETQIQKKEMLKGLGSDDNKDTIIDIMKSTYFLQRNDICGGMPINEFIKQWPFFFDFACISDHFEQLTGIKIDLAQEESLVARNKANRIWEYICSGKKKPKELKKWVSRVKEEVGLTKTTKSQQTGVSLLLINYFEEDEGTLFRFYGVTGNKEKIKADTSKPKTPFIAIIGNEEDIFQGVNLYYLVVECEVVTDRLRDFSEAVLVLFASFYALNTQYPKDAEITLEFIQREIVGINPDTGAKKKKKTASHVVHPKIVSLLNGIRDFESDWESSCTVVHVLCSLKMLYIVH